MLLTIFSLKETVILYDLTNTYPRFHEDMF